MGTPDSMFASSVAQHLARRPGMELRDVYKLLFQAIRGPEHLIDSAQAFAERLASEWAELDLAGDDPLWEPIRPDGGLLRLNLRPYKEQGGQPDQVVTACLETARRSWGTQVELEKVWMDFTASNLSRDWPGWTVRDLDAFTNWLRDSGFPAVHHSEGYRSLYRPAYRLVSADLCAFQ